MNARAAVTSREAYEAACDRFNAISAEYQPRKAALLRQLQALEDEYDAALAELRTHEEYGGIPLYNRCPTCSHGRGSAFAPRPPAGHDGPCES